MSYERWPRSLRSDRKALAGDVRAIGEGENATRASVDTSIAAHGGT